jgi:hypothetical protein
MGIVKPRGVCSRGKREGGGGEGKGTGGEMKKGIGGEKERIPSVILVARRASIKTSPPTVLKMDSA